MKISAVDKVTGKSESITITNNKDRFAQEEILRMVAEGEQFAAEDELHRKRIEALNNLSSFVYGLKGQLSDKEGLGGKIGSDDKEVLEELVQKSTEWIEEHGQAPSLEDLEERLDELRNAVNPTMTELYQDTSSGAKNSDVSDDDWSRGTDEL